MKAPVEQVIGEHYYVRYVRLMASVCRLSVVSDVVAPYAQT